MKSPPTADASASASNSSATDVAQPTRPKVTLRRSTRRVAQSNDQEEQTREIQAKVLGIKSDRKGMLCNYSEESEERSKATKEGVKLAIDGLATMERRLKMATKTQKQKVAGSTFADNLGPADLDDLDAESDAVGAATLRNAEPLKQSLLRSADSDQTPDKIKPQPSRSKHAAKRSELVSIAELEAVDQVNKDEADSLLSPERGAARLPPVNSSRLPLPWKGRLGYVGTLHSEIDPAVRF